MTKTLGAILAETAQNEKNHSSALAAQRAGEQSAKALHEFKLVERFFNSARQTFTEKIVLRVDSSKIWVLVGNTGSKQDNDDVASLLRLYTQTPPAVTLSTGRFASLWVEFTTWATEQGLNVVWSYEHDGVGLNSWYHLKVTPPLPLTS